MTIKGKPKGILLNRTRPVNIFTGKELTKPSNSRSLPNQIEAKVFAVDPYDLISTSTSFSEVSEETASSSFFNSALPTIYPPPVQFRRASSAPAILSFSPTNNSLNREEMPIVVHKPS